MFKLFLSENSKCKRCKSQNVSYCYFTNKWFCRSCGKEWKD